jgi:hypothetical protein
MRVVELHVDHVLDPVAGGVEPAAGGESAKRRERGECDNGQCRPMPTN